ncbi:MAG: hypothetical protein AAFN77_03105 [Planctomycetota bacterium]
MNSKNQFIGTSINFLLSIVAGLIVFWITTEPSKEGSTAPDQPSLNIPVESREDLTSTQEKQLSEIKLAFEVMEATVNKINGEQVHAISTASR